MKETDAQLTDEILQTEYHDYGLEAPKQQEEVKMIEEIADKQIRRYTSRFGNGETSYSMDVGLAYY